MVRAILGALAGALLLASAAAQQQSLKVVKGPQNAAGVTKLTQRIMPDGSKLVQLVMSLKEGGGRTVTIHNESVYSPKGRPIRKILRTSSGTALVQQITASFGPDAVQVTVQTGASKSTRTVAYPEGTIEAKSEFWVIRDKVAPGAVSSYLRFDTGTANWIPLKVTAVGPRKIKVGGKEVDSFLIQSGDVKTWMDGKGRVLRLESPGLILEDTP